jgi:hypothetical protein
MFVTGGRYHELFDYLNEVISKTNEAIKLKTKKVVPRYDMYGLRTVAILSIDISLRSVGSVQRNSVVLTKKIVRNDFILLDNKKLSQDLCIILDHHKFFKMKCYGISDISIEQLENYFLVMYKSTNDNYEILR